MERNNFSVIDYVVFVVMLLISSAIGLYFRFSGGRQKTASEFLFADGQMSAVPVAFSLMSSFISAVTLLGVSAEIYSYGTMFIVINIAYGICTPIAAYLFVPVYFKMGVTSAYEYLEKRFGKATRLSGSIAYSFQMILYMGVALYAPALALEAVSGMPKSYAILTVGLVCTFYSTIGGLKAVIFTDVFQSLLMFAAVFSIIVVAWIDKGSLKEIWRIADAHDRIEFGNFDLDPTVRHSWWSLCIGGGVTFLSVYAVNQGQIQRYMSAGNLETAQKSLWVNWPILSLLSLSTSFAGLAIFSKYAECDPFQACMITQPDQLMPYYVVDTMQHIPGLSGLFVSGIFSAALSTVSAAINSLAAVTLEDYIQPLYTYMKGNNFPGKGSVYAKCISVIYGLICIALAFLADQLGGVLQASLTILGVVGGPTLGLFSLGIFFPPANQVGALSGFFTSLVFTMWLGFSEKPASLRLPVSTESCTKTLMGNVSLATTSCFANSSHKRPEDYFYLFRFSYLWLGVMGLVVCLLVGIVLSLTINAMCGKSMKQTDPRMFAPPIASLLQRRHCIYNVNRRSKIEQEGHVDVRSTLASRDEATKLCPVTLEMAVSGETF